MRLGDRRVATLRGMLRQPRITHASCNSLHPSILIAAAAFYPPPRTTRKSSPIMPGVFNKSLYSDQLTGFSLAVSASGHYSLTSVGMPERMACRRLGPGVLSPHQCWLNPGDVLGGTFAQYDSQFNLTLMACYSSTASLFCWLAIVSAVGLIVLLVLFGVPSGITIALVIIAMAYCAPRRN